MSIGSVIRNPADRFQVALAIIGPVVLVLPFCLSLRTEFEIGLWVAVWLFICRHNYILHNHVHRPFTSSKPLNRIISVLLGFCTGMTAGNWKITHVHGHHVEDKIGLLPDRNYVRYFKVNENTPFTYFSATIHALKTAPLQWAVPVFVMVRESFRKRHFRQKFYRFYLLEFALVYGLVFGIFLAYPLKAFLYFGVIYSLVYVVGRYVDYVTHISAERESKFSFANVCLDTKYNKLFWNFGFHIAHHVNPRAHWTSLPSIYHDLNVQEQATPVASSVNYFGGFWPLTFRWHRVKDMSDFQ